jgi:murein DD-endopeptidase MepM/ murein hydrolase activator NlpD
MRTMLGRRWLVLAVGLVSTLPPALLFAGPPAPRRTPIVRVVDMNVGEEAQVTLSNGKKARVKLLALDEVRDSVTDGVRAARVEVEVSGSRVTLTAATYHLPVTVAGVQIDCAISKGYLTNSRGDAWGLIKDARLRLWPAGSPVVAPGTFGYPVTQRWFACGTQMANEPVYVDGGEVPGRDSIYYHYGLDFGGAEGMVDILAATNGLVVSAGTEKLPGYDDTPVRPRYDVVYVLDDRGWYYRYSHMESIDPAIKPGRTVVLGQKIGVLGKEGGSGGWTHLHFGIKARMPSGKWGTQAAYAFAWEAYRRTYDPPIIAVARPHHVAWTGEKVTLDGSRSWAAAGPISRWKWTFTDGTTAAGPTAERTYDRPGMYSETLMVTDAGGNTAYDFATVIVFDKGRPDRVPSTVHPTFAPTMGIRPGDPVTFKVRSFRTTFGKETWDFGDGSPPVSVQSDGNVKVHAKDGYAVTTHRFRKPGDYVVRVERTNEHGCRAIGHLHVRVEKGAGAATSAGDSEATLDLIRRAGNAEDDADRLTILKKLQQRPDLSPALRADADRMVALVERWLNDPSLWRWFSGPIRKTLDYPFKIAETSPLHPLTCLYRGRMLVWVTNEYGNVIGYHETRRRFLDKAVRNFRIARAAFPENRIIGMYLGEPIPVETVYPSPAGAPKWAALQRENLERLADIILWWIDNRLRENGEYGGAWDDDCEMWRHWVPVMIAFEYPKVTKAQAFFSKALLSQPYMKDGYTNHVYDVEHTAEPSSDTITPMMHLAPDDPAWARRAMRIAELMETLWTGRNRRGFLQFKSTYFSAQRVDPDPKRACDTPYHVRALDPVLVLWQRTGDPKLTALFSAWMDTWVDATARAERGKPAGIIPAAITWPTGEIGGPGPDWWDPRHHGEPRLYEWPSAMRMMTDMLLLTYHMTKDEKYLAPLRSMAAARRDWLTDPPRSPAPGSRAWCGRELGLLAGTLAKYRLLTGSTEFDDILKRDYRDLNISKTDPEHRRLAESLERSAEALRVNFPGYTSEVRFTDRVLTFPRLFGRDMMFPEPVPASNKRPSPQLLYATATGDRGAFNVFPINAVRWLTPPREIAALVTASGRRRFAAELFHFGKKPRPFDAELYLLEPGEYRLDIRDRQSGRPVVPPRKVSVTGTSTRIPILLLPGRLCTIEITAP